MQTKPLDPDPAQDRESRLSKRYVSALFVTFAAGFTVLSTYQIVVAVYDLGAQRLPVSRAVGVNPCSAELRGLKVAVDRAMARAALASDEGKATAEYRAALSPEWDAEPSIRAQCGAEAKGTDAFAALLRFRRAAEAFVRRQVVELAPLRQDVAAYLAP